MKITVLLVLQKALDFLIRILMSMTLCLFGIVDNLWDECTYFLHKM